MTYYRRSAHTTGITALQTNRAGPTRHSTPTSRHVVSWGLHGKLATDKVLSLRDTMGSRWRAQQRHRWIPP